MRQGPRILSRLRERAGQEGGWTLIELLVAMTIFTFALGAALSLFEVGVKSAPKEQERAAAIREAQTGLSSMVREVRDASEIFELTPNLIDFKVLRKGVEVHVRYECGVDDPDSADPLLYQCQRSQGTVGTPMPALDAPRTVIGRMQQGGNPAANPVFTYKTPPQEPLNAEDIVLDYPEAVPCNPPLAEDPLRYCLPAPWPTYLGVAVKVPAKGRNSGDGTPGGYTYSVSFSDAAYLRNLEASQSPYNSGS